MVAEIAAEGNKALVFSQFTAVLDEVDARLAGTAATREIPRFRLQGDTAQTRRSTQIAGFQQQEGAAVFLISLRAGGLGINLTAADYVFLLDPWWNPAVEAQAIDRAHRIGRDRPVFAYRLVARGTIEDKMLRLQDAKRALADALIREDGTALKSLSVEDIQGLFGR
jgi:SNF2 family DNA or RNA helicase